jgi:hypothetical protein
MRQINFMQFNYLRGEVRSNYYSLLTSKRKQRLTVNIIKG